MDHTGEVRFSVYPPGTQITGGIPFEKGGTRLDLMLLDDGDLRFVGSRQEVPQALCEAISLIRYAIKRAHEGRSRGVIEMELKAGIGYAGFSKGKAYVSVNP